AMSAFDLRNQSMQCTEPKIDYIVPCMKLKDQMLVFIDGKWVNEIYCQPPFPSQLKVFNKKAQNEWSVCEESRALQQENKVLQVENRMLWEESKALQCLQSQNKAVHVIYTDAIQQSLQNENKPFPFFRERNIGFQFSPGNEDLQAVQEKNQAFEDFHQENKRVPVTWKDQKAITSHKERKDAPSDLQNTDTIIGVEKSNPGLVPQQKHEGKKKSIIPTQNKIKSAPSTQGEHEILQVLQDLCELLKKNHFPEDKQGCHNLYDMDRSFHEDYKKLKLQLSTVKNTVSDIMVQMEKLEKEIIAITSPIYEEGGQKLATEHQLGNM
ncbi:SPERT protein, partial [Serilophus lunatus]|nr:SPERT protein [Serilophus lunatus]